MRNNMRAKDLIEKLQKLEYDTEIYVIDGLGFADKNIGVIYDEYENTAGIIQDCNFAESID